MRPRQKRTSISCASPSHFFPALPLLILHRRRDSSSNCAPQRVPRGHEQVQHHPKHVPRHARIPPPALHPKKEGHQSAKLAAFLLVLVLVLVLPVRHRHQCHTRQGLASCHPALQVGRGCSAPAEDGDKERGLLGVLLGLRILLKEGDGGVVGGRIQ